MNFTLHQLRVFQVIVEQASITKAAEMLHMTQPAVSIQLKNLQAQFDMPLTEVVGRKLYITEFGREVYRIADRILSEVSSIGYQTEQFRGILSGKLRLSVASTGKYVMPYYLKQFLQENPAIDLLMDVTNKTKVIRSLEHNEVDFALVSVLPDHLDIEQEILLPNTLYLTGARDAVIQPQKKLSKAVFQNIPLIYREAGSGTRVTMQRYFQQANIIPQVKLELTSNEAVKQAVMAGLGYSMLSVLSIKHELKQKEIKIIPVSGLPLTEHWRLIWLKQKKQTAVSRAFLHYIRSNKQAVYDRYFSWIEKVAQ